MKECSALNEAAISHIDIWVLENQQQKQNLSCTLWPIYRNKVITLPFISLSLEINGM